MAVFRPSQSGESLVNALGTQRVPLKGRALEEGPHIRRKIEPWDRGEHCNWPAQE